MMKSMVAAGALAIAVTFTGAAEAQSYISDWKYGPKFAATSVSNDGSEGLLVSRYLIFDYGVHRDNLRLNLQVFTGIAEDIWGDL